MAEARDTQLASNNQNETFYIFGDLETENIEGKYLLQIAAITEKGDTFNVFVNPCKPLPLSTTNFLGLYWYKNDLYKNGVKLNSKHITEALKAFMKWIENFRKPVMLVFHNGFAFDSLILSNKLVYFNINVPKNLISIGDTLPFFRKNLKAPEIENHKLSTLAKYFSIIEECSHDGLSDCVTLKLVCEKFNEKFGTNFAEIFKESSRKFEAYIQKWNNGTPLPKLSKVKIRSSKNKPAE
jgi:DNA polymerase III alpha subunit (gram-positive type)